jgi:hypothetical protein
MPNKTNQLLIDLVQVAGYMLAVFMVIALLAIPVRLIFGESDSVEARLQILIIGLMLLGATTIVSM